GEMLAAQATDRAAATKLRDTITTAIAADQAASLPPITPPRTKATRRATGANGTTRRKAARSGSTLVTVAPPVPQIDDVHAAGPAQDDPDRQEHLVQSSDPVDEVADASPGQHPRDQGRCDGPPGAHARPGAVTALVPGHERGQYRSRPRTTSKPDRGVCAGQSLRDDRS